MAIGQHVRQMFADMRDSYGGFGHGVNIGPCNPLDELHNPDLSDFERFAAQVAVVRLVADSIDESTYADALESELSGRLKGDLESDALFTEPMIKQVLLLAFDSERDFFSYLPEVYRQAIAPRVSGAGAA